VAGPSGATGAGPARWYAAPSIGIAIGIALSTISVVAAGSMRTGEIAVPTRYFADASSVGLRRSVVYGLSTLGVVARFLLHRTRLRRSSKLTTRRPAS
jgi:hypothetical protein